MKETLFDLYVNFGGPALMWLLAGLTGLLTKFVWDLIKNAKLRGLLSRAYAEIRDAVLEVNQTYVDALKKGREDGTLTDIEKAEAKDLAMDSFKSNFGRKGLKALGRVIGVSLDSWLSSKTEAAVAELKAGASANP